MSKYSDPLIYGKNQLERIVSIEVNNDQATIFTEDESSNVLETIVPNRFWILLPFQVKGSIRLDGGLHYQYGLQFATKNEWYKMCQIYRKRRVDFFTIYDSKESLMIKNGYTYFKGMRHNEPSILSFDIETTGLFHNSESKVLLISNTFRKNGRLVKKLFAYDEYQTQGDMLVDWSNWVREMNPSILCGHNIYTFDLPYLQFIADNEGVKLLLGRDESALNIATRSSKFRVDGSRDQEYHKVRVHGREVIDTFFTAIRHDVVAKKYDTYGLKAIIKIEGLEKTNRQFYDASQIRVKYQDVVEWKKIKEYCIDDADDALALYDLFIPATFYLSQSIPKSFQTMIESASGSQVNSLMVRSYLQDKHSIPKASEPYPFEGAISRGLPGVYKNCIRWDISSLYPSIMLQYEVYDKDKDPKCHFLKILSVLTKERLKNKNLYKETKDKYYDNLQGAEKIIINSAYGFFAAQGLNFNSPEAAEFITKTGRQILSQAIEWATGKHFLEWDKQFHDK